MSSKVDWSKPVEYLHSDGKKYPARVVCNDIKDRVEGTVVLCLYDAGGHECAVYTDHNGCTLGGRIQAIFNNPEELWSLARKEEGSGRTVLPFYGTFGSKKAAEIHAAGYTDEFFVVKIVTEE